MIYPALAFLEKYGKKIGYIFLALALVWGAYSAKEWHDDKVTQSYELGVSNTDKKWEKANSQQEKNNKEYKADQEARRQDLERQLAEALAKARNPDNNGGKKKDEYIQTPASKEKGLDDATVEIYNDSLGVSK